MNILVFKQAKFNMNLPYIKCQTSFLQINLAAKVAKNGRPRII